MEPHDFPLALTYDDVLLVPQRSGVQSRKDVSTEGRLTPTISLKLPIVSANMDTVTEAQMAIAMARVGGIGIIHRFLTVEQQAAEVRKVKRSESYMIESPWTVDVAATVEQALVTMSTYGVTGLPVVDSAGHLAGMLTRRDVVAANGAGAVRDAMTPLKNLVVGAPGVSLQDARDVMAERRVEKLPILSSDGLLGGLVTMRDVEHLDRFPNATKDARGRLRVGAAIGVRGDYLERARACAEAGADVLCLDIAHGHAEHSMDAMRELRRTVDIEIIAGNVATPEGARDLIEAGAHAIKVGVGPGSVCTTRIVAGVGVPQLSAVMWCAEICHEAGIPLCADGGIRVPGDVSKAMGAGADTVMVGNLLAGTTESPGSLLKRGGRILKVHRGMASSGGMDKREATEATVADPDAAATRIRIQQSLPSGASSEGAEFGRAVPEGVEAVVPYRGAASDVVHELVGGLRSAMSYSNATSIEQYHQTARFVRITQAGQIESHPHDVETEQR
jgi:IMP dehydrogenase